VLTGVDLLNQWVYMLWHTGEFLGQFVTVPAAERNREDFRTAIHSIHPRRVWTPPEAVGRPDRVCMGVERTATGRPTFYWVNEAPVGCSGIVRDQWRRIAARNVIHEFRRNEPGQIRGIPMMAPVLQAIADLRDYDAEVLEAARLATYFGVILSATGEGVEPLMVNESVEMERRRIVNAPPGWEPKTINPTQPSTNYVQFRTERQRDIGRPANMPANVVRLDSSNHNFSSARFDAQMYGRANKQWQSLIERRALNRMVRVIEQEAQLLNRVGERPERVRFEWVWPPALYLAADPLKEAKAATERLDNGTSTLSDELGVQGRDLDQHIRQLSREQRARANAGVGQPATGERQPGRQIEQAMERVIEQWFDRASDEHEQQQAAAGREAGS